MQRTCGIFRIIYTVVMKLTALDDRLVYRHNWIQIADIIDQDRLCLTDGAVGK